MEAVQIAAEQVVFYKKVATYAVWSTVILFIMLVLSLVWIIRDSRSTKHKSKNKKPKSTKHNLV